MTPKISRYNHPSLLLSSRAPRRALSRVPDSSDELHDRSRFSLTPTFPSLTCEALRPDVRRRFLPHCAGRQVDRVLLLPLSSVSVMWQIQADIRMVGIRFERRGFYASSIRRRLGDGQDRPPVKLLAGGASLPAARCRELRHLGARRMIHSVHGNPIVFLAHEKCLRNGLRPSGFFGELA